MASSGPLTPKHACVLWWEVVLVTEMLSLVFLWTWNCVCMIHTSFSLFIAWPAEFLYESLEMWWHLVTASEYCMLHHVCEQLFQPQILLITWTAGLWCLCSLQKAVWAVEWVDSWDTPDLPQACSGSCSVLDWFLVCILNMWDHVPGMDEEGYYRSSRS